MNICKYLVWKALMGVAVEVLVSAAFAGRVDFTELASFEGG